LGILWSGFEYDFGGYVVLGCSGDVILKRTARAIDWHDASGIR
jgi:hypothetical protein